MRVSVILLLALLAPASAYGEANDTAASMETAAVFPGANYTPLTTGGKFRLYPKSTFGPMSISGSVFSAAYNQAVDSVPEWGQGMEGYGRRFASSLGQKAVGNTTTYGLKILLREDPRYFYSGRREIRARTLHAIGETFVAHKDSGGARPNYSYFAGVASGVYISRQWRPEGDRGAADYIRSAAISVGARSAQNVFMEFWPDIRKKFLKR
ncbi:MAG: hypothetical protein LBJ21_03970 [Acidobacteriota bacterium]|jgi:hypothetical protein|nr:hypothetical protein [Acidobacteriota bacterium]